MKMIAKLMRIWCLFKHHYKVDVSKIKFQEDYEGSRKVNSVIVPLRCCNCHELLLIKGGRND